LITLLKRAVFLKAESCIYQGCWFWWTLARMLFLLKWTRIKTAAKLPISTNIFPDQHFF